MLVLFARHTTAAAQPAAIRTVSGDVRTLQHLHAAAAQYLQQPQRTEADTWSAGCRHSTGCISSACGMVTSKHAGHAKDVWLSRCCTAPGALQPAGGQRGSRARRLAWTGHAAPCRGWCTWHASAPAKEPDLRRAWLPCGAVRPPPPPRPPEIAACACHAMPAHGMASAGTDFSIRCNLSACTERD